MTKTIEAEKTAKKKKRVHVLRSEQKQKNAQYQKRLASVYGKYLMLAPETSYTGPAITTPHLCMFCGEVTCVKPSTLLPTERALDSEEKIEYKSLTIGRGCTICKTNSNHIAEFQQYQIELQRVHGNKFDFANLPLRFKIDDGKYRQVFKCNDCGMQHYQTPKRMLDPEFKCVKCESKIKIGSRTHLYLERLKELYDDKISIIGKYHDSYAMHHSCDQSHSWLATSASMLRGAGCPRCKTHVEVKRVEIEYRNQKLATRTRLEARGIRVFASKISTYSGIRTNLDFPIPVLYGKKSPAFMHPTSGIIADVIKLKDFKKFVTRKKFFKSKERAEKLGLDYGVILVGKEKAAGLWTMNWLSGEDVLPKNWNFDDLVLGNGNIRAPLFEI